MHSDAFNSWNLWAPTPMILISSISTSQPSSLLMPPSKTNDAIISVETIQWPTLKLLRSQKMSFYFSRKCNESHSFSIEADVSSWFFNLILFLGKLRWVCSGCNQWLRKLFVWWNVFDFMDKLFVSMVSISSMVNCSRILFEAIKTISVEASLVFIRNSSALLLTEIGVSVYYYSVFDTDNLNHELNWRSVCGSHTHTHHATHHYITIFSNVSYSPISSWIFWTVSFNTSTS